MAYVYNRLVDFIKREAEDRDRKGLVQIEGWFRMKSKLLNTLNQETLLDVIKHCDFVTKQQDDVIIHQGQKGHRFYILMRGSVSVLHKDSLEDVDLGEEGTTITATRDSLGQHIVTLGEGQTFGEIALINPDCIRTASVLADEKSDLVVIHRDLYNRSVSKVLAKEYAEKINFIESLPLLRAWQPKFRRQLAACLRKEILPFDCVLFKQGDSATNMYFVISGELKVTVDPEGHFQQFNKLLTKCSPLVIDNRKESQHGEAYFPQKLLPQLKRLTRVSRASQIQRPPTSNGQDAGSDATETCIADSLLGQMPQSWSPSAIRKMNAQINSRRVNLSLCYLGEKQYIGEVEFLLQLDNYHATTTCSQETSVFSLSRPHFDRIFRRRNPKSLQDMARTAELIMSRRVLKSNITDSVPFLKCIIYKLQEMFTDKRTNNDNDNNNKFLLPDMSFKGMTSSKPEMTTSKSYFWAVGLQDGPNRAAHKKLAATSLYLRSYTPPGGRRSSSSLSVVPKTPLSG